ncbi:MAG TPA: hypothetical protein VL025_11625, partial [Thermoanaerobaculia bacterium]|nr:hypothetical protein [Thermoanaerobaculia bacterium]
MKILKEGDPMTNRKRWAGLVVLAGLLLMAAEGAAWAECGTCQACKCSSRFILFVECSCMVANQESGSMCCAPEVIGQDT